MASFRFTLPLLLLFLFAPLSLAQSSQGGSDPKDQAAELFDRGQSEQAKGNLNNAVRIYTQAISLDAGLYQAYYQRAIALISLEQTGEAETDLRKVVQIQPDFARGHRALGKLLLDRGITEQGRNELKRALELDPKLKDVRMYYAGALIKTGDAAGAVDQLHAAIEQGEANAQVYALLGLAEERTGKKTEAIADYSKALELQSGDMVALEGRGRLEAESGDTSKAIEDLGAAYKIAPTPELALGLARLYIKAGQPHAAIQLYADQIQRRPNDPGIRIDMVRLMADNGEIDEAKRGVALLMKMRPKDFYVQMLAGDIYSKDSPAEAVPYYRAATEMDPNNNNARVQLGASLVRSRQYDDAIPLLQKAIAVEPDNVQAHSNIATALFEQKQFPEAAQHFLWIVQKKPSLTIAFYFLAISLDKIGDCYDALRSYQEFENRANPAVNAKEIEDARIRVSLLNTLVKHGKCKPPEAGKKKK